MTKPKTPCYQCNERTPTCHGPCKRYIAYRAMLDAYNKENAGVYTQWRCMSVKKNVKKYSDFEN